MAKVLGVCRGSWGKCQPDPVGKSVKCRKESTWLIFDGRGTQLSNLNSHSCDKHLSVALDFAIKFEEARDTKRKTVEQNFNDNRRAFT